MLGGLLRELALGLHSPVLALGSQNRSAGNYGNGKGSAALDSLKESGDLEYAADGASALLSACCACPVGVHPGLDHGVGHPSFLRGRHKRLNTGSKRCARIST